MTSNRRFWLLMAAALVVVVLLVGGSGQDGPPYDPRSVNPDGARGIVEMVERLGGRVDVDQVVPTPESTTAMMLQDRLSFEDESQLRAWVRDGGVVVIADIRSSLAADDLGLVDSVVLDATRRGICTIDALDGAEELPELLGSALDARSGSSCFGDGERALIVAEPLGEGTVVTVGSPDLFTNAVLNDNDAAVVALSLLAPTGGDAHMTFIGPSVVDFGEEGLGDLVAPRVRNAILQLLAAFLLFALYKSRRLGGVVAEPVPVRLDGSDVVRKAGLLSERAKDPASAAALLQGDVLQRARVALSVPSTDGDSEVAERLAGHLGLPPDTVTAALLTRAASEEDLVRITMQLGDIDARLFTSNESQPA